jgi:hypothetical protein
MSRSKAFLALFAILALAWTGFLTYLAVTVADPIVVSAPQLQLATIVVAADVKPAGKGLVEAKLVKIFKDDPRRPGQLPPTFMVQWESAYDVPGVNTYLLALTPVVASGDTLTYAVTAVPRYIKKPGNPPPDVRVYPYTDSVRIQAERILGR